MTACPILSRRRCIQILQGNIAGRVELTVLRSGRAVASVNLPSIRFYFKRLFGRTMQLTIIAIITPLTFKQYQNGRAGDIC
jgi:hypothetical protein